MVLWTQHHTDEPSIQSLASPRGRDFYDGLVFVSEWQRAEFLRHFALPPERTTVLPNAVAPAFLNSFSAGQPILPEKALPPVLAYTSTPYRGLDLLLEAFPAVQAQVPDVRLRVFSSMQVYHVPSATDLEMFGALYERCRRTPGHRVCRLNPAADPRPRNAVRRRLRLSLQNSGNILHRRPGSHGQRLPDRDERLRRPPGDDGGICGINSSGTRSGAVSARIRGKDGHGASKNFVGR